MDEYQSAKLDGGKIFRSAITHIKTHGWNHNTMEILLKVSNGKVWPQPMAVLMFSELGNVLGSKTLTQFDKSATTHQVIELLNKVADQLTTSN